MVHKYQGSVKRGSQRGFVLVISLLFLVVLTILGLSIMGTSTLNERMTGYFIDRQIALQAAEAALRDAERDLLFSGRIAGLTGFASNCLTNTVDALCLPETDGTPIWVDMETTSNNGWLRGEDAGPTVAVGTFTDAPTDILPGVAAMPRYVIEAINLQQSAGGSLKVGFGPQQATIVYRVTAVGFGRTLSTRVVLQALYKL